MYKKIRLELLFALIFMIVLVFNVTFILAICTPSLQQTKLTEKRSKSKPVATCSVQRRAFDIPQSTPGFFNSTLTMLFHISYQRKNGGIFKTFTGHFIFKHTVTLGVCNTILSVLIIFDHFMVIISIVIF